MTIDILGVKIDPVTFAGTLEHIESFIHHGGTHQIVTVNPEFVMRAQTDKGFKQILNESDLALPDGYGLVLASRYLAKRSPRKHPLSINERVMGSDLVGALAEVGAKKKWKIYYLGGKPGMAKETADFFKKKYPNLKIVGAECGPRLNDKGRPVNKDQEALLETVLNRIHHTKPDILLVGFGAPKQDYFIHRYRNILKIPVMIGVGGSFEFYGGELRRAPSLMRILGLEWLWRLVLEPKRIGRIWTAVIKFPIAVFLKSN